MVCIYNGIQIGIKKEQNDVIFSNRDCHTEWSEVRHRKTNIIWYCLYAESKYLKKKSTNELTKQE